MTASFGRVAVLGLGLIGGSLVRAVRHSGHDVVGYDPDAATVSAVSASGFPVAASVAGAVHGADLVVLAMPLPELRGAVEAVAPHLGRGAVLTDVGTLKLPVLAAVRELAPRARFVGGHPLAGTEYSGWLASDPMLFRDAPWALTAETDTDLDAWLAMAELACDLGAKPVPTTAAEQDAAVARVIGLPHMLGEALAVSGIAAGPLALSLAAGSYTSGSRVARTRPPLVASWCDGNATLIESLDDVIAELQQARDALAAGDSVLGLAEEGHAARIGWEQRLFVPVELSADPESLRAHGRAGGWVTAVLRDDDGVRLLGMRPR